MATKEVILSGLLLFSGFLAGWFWGKVADNPLFVVFVLFYAMTFGFFLLLERKQVVRWGAGLASFILLAAAFFKHIYLLTGFLFGLLIFAYAIWAEEVEERSETKIALKRTLGGSLKIFFTSLAVLFSFIYYGSIYKNSDAVSLIIPQSVFRAALKAIENPMQVFLPGVKADTPLDDALTALLITKFKESGELKGPIDKAMEAQIMELMRTERFQYGRKLGMRLTGKEPISEILYNFSLVKIKEYAGPYITYIPAIAALSYFVALKAASVILYYLALLGIFLLLKLFLLVGLITKITIPAEKEIYV